MATYSFTNRVNRLKTSALTRRSNQLTSGSRAVSAPRVGPAGFLYRLLGTGIDELQSVSFDTSNPDNPISSTDAFYYNEAASEGGNTVFMDIYINNSYRSTVEFDVSRVGTEFGYSFNQLIFGPNLTVASQEAPFTEYNLTGVFAEGTIDLTVEGYSYPVPVPSSTPEPTATLPLYPPPTPEATETPYPTAEPTSTEIPEPTPTPTPTETAEP